MISALKKKFAAPPSPSGPPKTKQGISLVNADLQRRFANGVNFNMKVVIRGDRNTGKTCLFKRLQGQPFSPEYVPTDEIQVSNITWSYRTSDFIVKVDVWDVVDESQRRKKRSEGLKLDNSPRNASPQNSGPEDLMVCDATFVDVYKNCSGVLLVFDITKQWTWKYVQAELGRIPPTLPVLVLANKTDMEEKREVREEEVVQFLSAFRRPACPPAKLEAPIRLTTSSMKTASGLRYLYNFLNIPFLFVQREQLENALEVNRHEIQVAQCELDYFAGSPNSPQPSLLNRSNQPIPKPEIVAPDSTTSTPQVQRKKSVSSGSGDDNQMVDLYEEDFDSNDEYQRTLDQFVAKSSTTSVSTSPPPVAKKSSVEDLAEALKHEIQLQPPTPTSPAEPEVSLDEWLQTATPTTSQVSEPLDLADSSDDQHNDNPLVARVEGESTDTEESADVFVAVQRPKAVEKPKSSAIRPIPSALESFLADEPANSAKRRKKPPKTTEDKTKLKPKSKKKRTTKKTEMSSSVLVEDSPSDLGVGDYDPL